MKGKVINTAENLVSTYGTNNPEELCRLLGIVVVDQPLPKVTKGFCLTLAAGRAIVLNEKLQPRERQSCIAHELGHALLHNGINYMFVSQNTQMVTGKYETEADLFAAALLLNGESISEDTTLTLLAQKHHLPETAVGTFFEHIL